MSSDARDVGEALDQLQLRYQRVERALRDEIERGGRAPGSRLPPERKLAEHFGVSRVTLRRALEELEQLGVVARTSTGWTVASPPIGEPANELMSFSEMAAARGLTPSARVLGFQERPASIDEAEGLRLAPGALLVEIERLRMMDDVPILIDRTLLPASLVPGLASTDLERGSLYAVLKERYGLSPTWAWFTVEAVAADERRARLLGLEPGEPLLRCTQETEDVYRRRIELCEMTYRGDRYRFRAMLARGR